jgi:ATP-binding cassette, subfamily B, bacterial
MNREKGGIQLLALVEGGFSFNSGRWPRKPRKASPAACATTCLTISSTCRSTTTARPPTGELIQRSTSDVDAIRRFFADQAIGFGRVVLLFVINFAALLQLNVQLALDFDHRRPFVVIASFFFFKRITKAYEAYQEQDAVLSTTLQENLSGVRVVKAFARQRFEIDKFERDNWKSSSAAKSCSRCTPSSGR